MKNLKRFVKAVFGLGVTKGQVAAQNVSKKATNVRDGVDKWLGDRASDLETLAIAKTAGVEKPDMNCPEVKAGQRTDERDDG